MSCAARLRSNSPSSSRPSKLRELGDKADQAPLDILTEAQRTAFEKLKGEKFELDRSQLGPRKKQSE